MKYGLSYFYHGVAKKTIAIILPFLMVFGLTSCVIPGQIPSNSRVNQGLPATIAFGSCGHELRPMPALDSALSRNPDLFIYLGDNIYGDTTDMNVLRAKYKTLSERPEFQRLRKGVPLIATWDDHDYGQNDAGKEYPKKVESKTIFLDFWGEPPGSERRRTEGVYTSYNFEEDGKRLQIILLDTRTFRDDLLKNDGSGLNKYIPHKKPGSSMLGEVQWVWLEKQFLQQSDLRIIGSSNQFSHEYNGRESWTNFPFERQRMIDLIRRTEANGVVFISGDVHWGEISRLSVEGAYDLYDVTSSGINRTRNSLSPNANRIGNAVRETNFGLIEIDWSNDRPTLSLSLFDSEGNGHESIKLNDGDLEF